MKIKLFRIFTLIFVLASVVNLAFVPTSSADPASDQQSIGLIVECKGKQGPFPADSNCGKYTICLTSAGKPGDDDICKSLRAFNGIVTPLSGAALTGCKKTKPSDECIAAYGNCIFFHVKSNKVSAEDTKTCSDLVTQGKLDEANKNPNAEKTSCVIQGIGWLICPVMTFLANVVDAAYLFVSSLLTVQPLLTDTGDAKNSIYKAWSIMRNFANVAFVVAFLLVILSQVSSIGITNYGIKKLLPKLIVSAILVNISYWLCAIAVDISNILGVSFKGLFDSLEAGLAAPTGVYGTSAPGWKGMTVGVLEGSAAVGALLYIGVSALFPALIVVLLAIVVVFLVLTLRQALIILLIVVAPLAFVAYLLPNTESMFKKWRELFQTLLLMYPIIALIFGASSVASKIVMTSAQGPYKIAIQIMGAMIAVIPLAITPVVMKSAGGLLNRFGGIINNPNKGPFDRMKKGAEGYRKNREMLRDSNALGSRKYRFGQSMVRRKARRKSVLGMREGILKDTNTAYIAGQAMKEGAEGAGDNMFAKQMAGGGVFTDANENVRAAVVASAVSQEHQMFQNDVKNMESLVRIKFENNPEDALEEAIKDGNKTQAVAAQNVLFASGSGGVSKFRDTVQKAEGNSDPTVQAGLEKVTDGLKTNVKEQHGQYAKQKGADVVSWANDSKAKLSSTGSMPLSDNELAGQHSKSIRKMADRGEISKEQAESIMKDPRVSANLDPVKKALLGNIAHMTPSPEQLTVLHEQANEDNARRNT